MKKYGIHWAVNFKDPKFYFRLIATAIIPALTYLGIEWQSLTTWAAVGYALKHIFGNPLALLVIIINIINFLPKVHTQNETKMFNQQLGIQTPQIFDESESFSDSSDEVTWDIDEEAPDKSLTQGQSAYHDENVDTNKTPQSQPETSFHIEKQKTGRKDEV